MKRKYVKKEFVKFHNIIRFSSDGMVTYYIWLDINYPPKWVKTECYYANELKKLEQKLLNDGYVRSI